MTLSKLKERGAIIAIGFVMFAIAPGGPLYAQDTPEATEIKVAQLIEKKAEYHRLTNGEQSGYRIKIHFGDRESANNIRTKFAASFPDLVTYEEYQQPYFVVLVGDYRTKLEAFKTLKKVKSDFPNAFIVKGKIKPSSG
jgi:hypothetical protein